MSGLTYGLLWYKGYFRLYILWHDPLPPRHWQAHRLSHRKYRDLDNALRLLANADAVMIFAAALSRQL
jgi:hypothetical protein